MIGKTGPKLRGKRIDGLVRYLYGPGRANEHTNPHMVAAWVAPGLVEPPITTSGKRDFRRLIKLLNEPLANLPRAARPAKPVWHTILRAHPDDPILTDQQWGTIARKLMHTLDLAETGDDTRDIAWIAVRHADDHIHLVANLVRPDGTVPQLSNDFAKTASVRHWAEQTYRLRPTDPETRTAAPTPTRAELGKAARTGRAETPRERLRRTVRHAAAAATSPGNLADRLQKSGYLVEFRYSTQQPGQITGYRMAVAGDTTRAGTPIWYSGRALAPDLTWPRLAARWNNPNDQPDTSSTRHRLHLDDTYRHAVRITNQAATALGDDPHRLAPIAGGATDLIAALAIHHDGTNPTGRRRLPWHAIDDDFARTARTSHRRSTGHDPLGTALRGAARALLAARTGHHPPGTGWYHLAEALSHLAATIAETHATAHRTQQASAARRTAATLRIAGQAARHPSHRATAPQAPRKQPPIKQPPAKASKPQPQSRQIRVEAPDERHGRQ